MPVNHAMLSPSSAHRWLHCTPSALLEKSFSDTSSPASAEGTAAHALADHKVKRALRRRSKRPVSDYNTDEMEECTDDYRDFVMEQLGKERQTCSDAQAYTEIELDLSAYIPHGFGTSDCIIVSDNRMHVIDLKYGQGVLVESEENPQMMLYALGAYQKYRLLYPIETVQMEIIQPRIDNYSSYSCSLKELLAFGEEVRKKADAAIKGEGEFKPGDWCRFCRARAKCKARADYNVQLAFAAGTPPELLTDEQIGEYLKKGEDVASWLSDVKEYALKACLDGKSIPGWKAVRGRSVRVFDDTDAAFRDAMKAGVEEALLYERKPLSLSKVEKLMGKKRFNEELGSHVIKPPGKPTLAHESDKREAVTDIVTPEEAFK